MCIRDSYIHTTFTLHLHIDGASSRSFERHFYDLKETRLSILLLLSGHLFLLNGWLLLLVFHFIPLLLQLNWEKIRQHFNISGCYWKSICFSISASMLLPAKSDNSPSFLPTIVYSRKIVNIFLQISAFHLPEADCFIFTPVSYTHLTLPTIYSV